MNETLASGMVPYHHIIGGETGMGEDRRCARAGAPVLQLDGAARARTSSTRARSRTSAWSWASAASVPHAAARRDDAQYMDGLYYALLEGRFLFDFVHEDKLDAAGAGEVLGAAAAQRGAAQRRAMPTQLRAYVAARRLAAGARSRPACSTTAATSGGPISALGRRLRHPQGRRDRRHDRQRVHGAASRSRHADPRRASARRR